MLDIQVNDGEEIDERHLTGMFPCMNILISMGNFNSAGNSSLKEINQLVIK